jgi:monoamine oxidase
VKVGIAGLTAPYEVATRTGCQVTVLETSDRPGGRIRTHRFEKTPGTDELDNGSEFGAMRIPTQHLGVLHYVCKSNLHEDLRLGNYSWPASYSQRSTGCPPTTRGRR